MQKYRICHAHAGDFGYEIMVTKNYHRVCGDMTKGQAELVLNALNRTTRIGYRVDATQEFEEPFGSFYRCLFAIGDNTNATLYLDKSNEH